MDLVEMWQDMEEAVGQEEMEQRNRNKLLSALNKVELRQRELEERELEMRLAAAHRYTA